MIIQPSLSELARQGNPKAIASLITRSLKAQGITAKASLKEGCLRVLLEAQQVPEQEATVQFIRKGLTKLRVECIKTVKLYGKQVDQDFPAWSQELDLEQQTQDITHKPPQAQRTQPNLSDVSHQSDLSNSLLNTPNSIAQADIAQQRGNPTTTRDSTKPFSQDSEANFKAANVLQRLAQTLIGFFGLQIGCESLFVIYAIVWATSYYIYNLLDVADATGILAYLIHNLVVVVDYFFYPLEFLTVWIYRISILITLIWLHRLHASLRTIDRGYPITPWGAITRFALPFYNIWGMWNVFATLANRFKSQGSELARRGTSLLRWLPWFYVALIGSNVLSQIYWHLSRTTADGDLSPWFFVARNGARLFLSVVWLQIVRIISKGISQALHNQNLKVLDVNFPTTDKPSISKPKNFSIKAIIYGLLVDIIGTQATNYLIGFGFGVAGSSSVPIVEIFYETGSFLIVNLLIGLLFTLSGGIVTAHVAQRLELKHAFVMGASSVFLSLIISGFHVPNQYYAIAILLAIPAALLGGYLRRITRTS